MFNDERMMMSEINKKLMTLGLDSFKMNYNNLMLYTVRETDDGMFNFG